MKTQATFVAMLVGLPSAALAQNYTASMASSSCAHLRNEVQVVDLRTELTTAEVRAQRAALDGIESRLQQQVAPDELMELVEVRLELGARIREGERALHMERANAQMVEARLRAAGCR